MFRKSESQDTISTSDIKIGENYISSLTLGTGQSISLFSNSSGLSRLTIPNDIAWGKYYVGLHVFPKEDSPSENNSSNNWVAGNTVQIPLIFGLDNNTSKNIRYLYLRKTGESSWGKNIINSNLFPGTNLRLCIELDDTADYYDLYTVSEDGYYWLRRNVRLQGASSYIWKIAD
jgi:hypothetical protein